MHMGEPTKMQYKDTAQKMLSRMDRRFSVFLDITAENFSPLPAAACFVDLCVAETLLENDDIDVQNFVKKAEDYIAHLVPQRVQVREEQLTDDEQVANEGTEAPELNVVDLSSSVLIVQDSQDNKH